MKTIEISFLKKWGYFKPGMQVSGVIRWTRESRVMASISFVYTMDQHHTLRFPTSMGRKARIM
ncbi:hypothetical protein KRR40_13000 [Niabella defluvii]|nr:hypothetical protein KRR40_13000 [Niabella sp. I65]